jgi:glycosyltransferase involved in cell wall biosynthesis
MRIAIDGYNFALPHGTGVATYGYVLADMLRALGHEVEAVFGIAAGAKADTREVLFFERLGLGPQPFKASEIAGITSGTAKSFGTKTPDPIANDGVVDRRAFTGQIPRLERLWTLPHMFEIGRVRFQLTSRFLTIRLPNPPAVMHWTYPVPVRMAGCPNIYTLHDLVPLKLPHTTLDDKRYYYRMVAECVRSADHICTVSEASRKDVLEIFGADPAKVTNTYQSSPLPAGLSADPAEDAAMVRGIFDLEPGSYFLFFGALDPKKNLNRILDAFLTAQTSRRLVVVGARDWGMNTDNRLSSKANPLSPKKNPLRALADNHRILQLDYQPRSLLFRLIRGARAVLFPSLYEGFGLPALEAMQLGTPVISSTVSSLPEVVGNAGLLVDPYDVGAIASAIRTLDTDDALYERLGHAGIEQARRFDDECYRSRLAALYGRIAG